MPALVSLCDRRPKPAASRASVISEVIVGLSCLAAMIYLERGEGGETKPSSEEIKVILEDFDFRGLFKDLLQEFIVRVKRFVNKLLDIFQRRIGKIDVGDV